MTQRVLKHFPRLAIITIATALLSPTGLRADAKNANEGMNPIKPVGWCLDNRRSNDKTHGIRNSLTILPRRAPGPLSIYLIRNFGSYNIIAEFAALHHGKKREQWILPNHSAAIATRRFLRIRIHGDAEDWYACGTWLRLR